MSQLISLNEFKRMCPTNRNPEKWVDAFNTVLPKYGITRGKRLAMFITQCGHESSSFNIMQENLNYSKDGLRSKFSKYFPDENSAFANARQPIRIANIVYANRMGNGGFASGDGWKYRGKGPIQITGKNNHRLASKFIFGDENVLVDNPDLLLQEDVGLAAACWFWVSNNLNTHSDNGDVVRATRVINGGTNGLADRQARYALAMQVLGAA